MGTAFQSRFESTAGTYWCHREAGYAVVELGIRNVGADEEREFFVSLRQACGPSVPVLVQLSENSTSWLSRRDTLIGLGASEAVALLAETPEARVFGNVAMWLAELPSPTRLFVSRSRAVDWLTADEDDRDARRSESWLSCDGNDRVLSSGLLVFRKIRGLDGTRLAGVHDRVLERHALGESFDEIGACEGLATPRVLELLHEGIEVLGLDDPVEQLQVVARDAPVSIGGEFGAEGNFELMTAKIEQAISRCGRSDTGLSRTEVRALRAAVGALRKSLPSG